MDIYDKYRSRDDLEFEMKEELKILVCFAKPDTGNSLCRLVNCIIPSKNSKDEVTSLHLIDRDRVKNEEDIERYKTEALSKIEEDTSNMIEGAVMRSFCSISDDYVSDILDMADTISSNLILIGMGESVFGNSLWNKYLSIFSQPEQVAIEDTKEIPECIPYTSKGVSTLLDRFDETTGIFIDKDFSCPNRIFVPILEPNGVYVAEYIRRFMENGNTEVMIWDTIGIIENDEEINKIYKSMQKRYGSRFMYWDNDCKIEYNFIESQDLILIGFESWDKLLNSAIAWSHLLPSTLIIHHKTV